jgi:Ser/Thr protein kinase RdoA (MazF antagonist)
MLMPFQPDIFSAASPQFSPITAASEAMVRAIVERCYPQAIPTLTRLEQFGGNEINSNNFRLSGDGAVLLLKRLPVNGDAAKLERQLELVEWLRQDEGIRLPVLIRTHDNRALGVDAQGLWCLFEFLEGDFFQGGMEQVLEMGREIGRLQVALRRCPSEMLPPSRWEYFTADDAAVYRAAFERRKEWSTVFDRVAASLLEEASESVHRNWQELQATIPLLAQFSPMACHCDLHPHNLLLRGARLSGFIDFESFVRMPAEAALGFATFKLLRQHAVAEALDAGGQVEIRRATQAFLAAMAESGEPCGRRPESLRSMALAEILRRLLVIFRLNLRDGNRAWNHVLPIHLCALQELEVILGYARE